MSASTTTRLRLSQFEDQTFDKEYRDAVRAAGRVEGAYLLIPTDRLNLLKRQYGRPLPSLSAQLSNASRASARIISAAIAGQPIRAAADVIAARQSICASCLDLRDGRCAKCGCFYRAKIQLATERCPAAKWQAAL